MSFQGGSYVRNSDGIHSALVYSRISGKGLEVVATAKCVANRTGIKWQNSLFYMNKQHKVNVNQPAHLRCYVLTQDY